MDNDLNCQLLQSAKTALRRGKRSLARELAHEIVANNPDEVEGWLILGGLSSPKSSLAYLEKAYILKPDDPRVNEALNWARQRAKIRDYEINLNETQKLHPFFILRNLRFHPPLLPQHIDLFGSGLLLFCC